jgi:uncharacterized membrane protein YeaQ/YmgE (transglycosylase-associated protein family)
LLNLKKILLIVGKEQKLQGVIFMDIVNLIISLVSGAVGGNIAGAATSEKNLGPLFNTVAGIIGGGAGDFILKALGVIASTQATTAAGTAATGSEFDIVTLLTNIAVSGVSGGALTGIITLIKDAMDKK